MNQEKVVLIVDDDVIVCKGLRRLIPWEEFGVITILECHNGREAYEVSLLHMPDLIISDIRMPDMDGLTLCRRLNESMIDIPIILLSAYEDFEYARTAMRYGVHDYFLKPMDRQRITELINVRRNVLQKKEKKRNCYSNIFDGRLQQEIWKILQQNDTEKFICFLSERAKSEDITNETRLVFCIGLVDLLYKYIQEQAKNIHSQMIPKEEAVREIVRLCRSEDILDYVKKLYLQVMRLSLEQKAKKEDTLGCIQEYIEEHYADDTLSVSYLAEMFHYTPSYLSDFFKRKTQLSLNTYIARVRVKKACELLEQPFSKVTTVAKQVGYRDSLYFSKVFKKYYGMTPSDYQNLNRKKVKNEED